MPTHYQGTAEERRGLDLFIKIARSSESFFERTTRPIEEAGLTASQFGVLETLYHLGPLTPSMIAEKHLKSRNNLSVVIAHLERDGLIKRVNCPHDRRSHWIHLEEAGRRRIEEVLPKFVEVVVRESSILSPGEQEQLAALLKKLGQR